MKNICMICGEDHKGKIKKTCKEAGDKMRALLKEGYPMFAIFAVTHHFGLAGLTNFRECLSAILPRRGTK